MNQKNNYFDKVYSFLEGELNENEKLAFLNELEKNAELKKEFELQSSLNQFLNDKDILSFQNKLKNVEAEIENLKNKQIRFKRFLYSAAAIFILLVTTVIITQYYEKQVNAEKLFAEYYAFNSSGEITRGENDIGSDLSKGLIEYDLHNYTNAIEILQKVIIKDSLNIKAIFYMSMSYIETGKYEKAITNLETLTPYYDHILIDQIKWYLALCYIKVNNKEKAIQRFAELASSDYYCKDKAKEILEKLKQQ